MHCRHCGRGDIVADAAICVGCGAPPRTGTAFCPNCGAPTAPGAAACTNCGVALVAMAPPPPPPGAYPPPQQPGYAAPPPQQQYAAPPQQYAAPPPGYGAPAPAAGVGPGGQPLAEWLDRVLAALIDGGIVTGIIIVGFILAAVLGAVVDVLGLLVLLGSYFGGLGFFVWQLIVQGQTGQTFGKQKIGLRLVSLSTGQPIGPLMSIVRYIVHFVDAAICYIGYLFPLWDPMKQTLADKILGTVVTKPAGAMPAMGMQMGGGGGAPPPPQPPPQQPRPVI